MSPGVEYVEPTDAERRAVREYCIAKSAISRESEPFQQTKRDLAKTKQTKRDEIFNYMIDHDLVCCQLPRGDAELRSDQELRESGGPQPRADRRCGRRDGRAVLEKARHCRRFSKRSKRSGSCEEQYALICKAPPKGGGGTRSPRRRVSDDPVPRVRGHREKAVRGD